MTWETPHSLILYHAYLGFGILKVSKFHFQYILGSSPFGFWAWAPSDFPHQFHELSPNTCAILSNSFASHELWLSLCKHWSSIPYFLGSFCLAQLFLMLSQKMRLLNRNCLIVNSSRPYYRSGRSQAGSMDPDYLRERLRSGVFHPDFLMDFGLADSSLSTGQLHSIIEHFHCRRAVCI